MIKPSPALTEPRHAERRAGARASAVRHGRRGHAPARGGARAARPPTSRLAEEAFYREARRVAALSLASIAEHTRGASVVYRDPLSALWRRARGSDPLAYAVISVRRNGERSPVSNIVTLTPGGRARARRRSPCAMPEEGRLCLEWLAPETDVLGKPAAIAGYRVYRRALSEEEYGSPLNLEPATGTSYVDTTAPYGVPLVYTVRAVLEGNPKVEGLPGRGAAGSLRRRLPAAGADATGRAVGGKPRPAHLGSRRRPGPGGLSGVPEREGRRAATR